MSFDEFDYADNCNDEKRMLDAYPEKDESVWADEPEDEDE